jgi:hypothetical protein
MPIVNIQATREGTLPGADCLTAEEKAGVGWRLLEQASMRRDVNVDGGQHARGSRDPGGASQSIRRLCSIV